MPRLAGVRCETSRNTKHAANSLRGKRFNPNCIRAVACFIKNIKPPFLGAIICRWLGGSFGVLGLCVILRKRTSPSDASAI